MTTTPPTPGVEVTTAEGPITTSALPNYATVVLGVADDGKTPAIAVHVGRVHGKTTVSHVQTITSADLVEDLGHAFLVAADHLREAAQ